MNDQYFEQWTEALPKLRQARIEDVKAQIGERGPEFKPKEFFDLLGVNLEKLLNSWWELESQSWKENPNPDLDEARNNLVGELESIIEFELDAIQNEVADVRAELTWKDEQVQEGEKNLQRFCHDVIGNYRRKIDGLINKTKEAEEAKKKTEKPRVRTVYRHSGGGGGGRFIFLFVGLLFGSAPSFYFWDSNKRAADVHIQEIEQVQSEKREIVDEMAILSETYVQLAKGKMLTIPQLKKQLAPIRATYRRQRSAVLNSYNKKEANLRLRVPEGDRLDRSLARLENAKQDDLAQLDAKEKAAADPLVQQLKIHEELLEQGISR